MNFIGTGAPGVNTTFNLSSVTYDTGDPAPSTSICLVHRPGELRQAQATLDARQAQFGLKLIY